MHHGITMVELEVLEHYTQKCFVQGRYAQGHYVQEQYVQGHFVPNRNNVQ